MYTFLTTISTYIIFSSFFRLFDIDRAVVKRGKIKQGKGKGPSYPHITICIISAAGKNIHFFIQPEKITDLRLKNRRKKTAKKYIFFKHFFLTFGIIENDNNSNSILRFSDVIATKE